VIALILGASIAAQSMVRTPATTQQSDTIVTKTSARHMPPFIGGMFFHCGLGSIRLTDQHAAGLTTGVGGKLAFLVLPRLRIGGMGFNSGFEFTSSTALKGSYATVRCGGLTAEYTQVFGAVRIAGGCLLGGGSVQLLQLHEQIDTRTIASYSKTATMIALPTIGVEVKLTPKLNLATMFDWMLGSAIAGGNSFGPQLHCGILFNR
jgi:hypothetical protein